MGLRTGIRTVVVAVVLLAGGGVVTGCAQPSSPAPIPGAAGSTASRSAAGALATGSVAVTTGWTSNAPTAGVSRGPSVKPGIVRPTPTPTPTPIATARLYGSVKTPIKVVVTGQVLASAKGLVVICPPFASNLVGTVSAEPQTPDCQDGIPIIGVDLNMLSLPDHNSHFRWGQAHFEAWWDGRSLKVRTQLRTTSSESPGLVDQPVTCPAPAAGWSVGGVQNDLGVGKIKAALGATYGGLAMGYPHGGPTNADGNNPSYGLQNTEQVVVVGVTGDPAAATRTIRTVFKGNLCVVHSDLTDAEVQQQQAAINAAIDWPKFGAMSTSQPQKALGVPGPIEIDVIVDTPALEQVLSTIPGPPLTVVPWIKPIT